MDSLHRWIVGHQVVRRLLKLENNESHHRRASLFSCCSSCRHGCFRFIIHQLVEQRRATSDERRALSDDRRLTVERRRATASERRRVTSGERDQRRAVTGVGEQRRRASSNE